MSLVIYCLVVAASIWVAARAVVWMPAYYAREEAAMIAAIRAMPANAAHFEAPDMTPGLWHEWLLARLPLNWLTYFTALAISLTAVWLWWFLGVSPMAYAWLLFSSTLVTLALVDYQAKLLPDVLTIPLVWAGLVLQLFPATASVGLEMGLIGAVAGYMPLWLLAQVYRVIRGRDGLGMGDLKLLAAMGAWSGPWILPQVVFLAALMAIVIYLIGHFFLKSETGFHEQRPFGPWLILAYFACVLITTF